MFLTKRGAFIGLGSLVVAATVAIWMLVTSHAKSPLDGLLYWPSYHRGQQAVADRLNDPESARFKNLWFHMHNGKQYLCGVVNGRNRMGGYTGYSLFYTHADAGFDDVQIAAQEDTDGWRAITDVCIR